MKKDELHQKGVWIGNALLKKIWRTMKLTGLFMLVSFIAISAGTYSQTTQFSFNIENGTLNELFLYIEQNSEFRFAYNKSDLDDAQRISFKFEKESVEQILNKVLDTEKLSILVKNDYIIISNKGNATDKPFNNKQSVQLISGKVTDSSGISLPGVTIVVKGTTQGIITDTDGKYSLNNVPNDATLVFSFVGMKSQEIPVAGKTSINVVMVEDAIGIEEVVAIGYGTQKKINLTGAVSSVKSDILVKTPTGSTVNTLAGRLPGLVVKQTIGQPGFDEATINIRNFGDALVIVDGSEQSFNNIDPNEIESISILKDASAAIYGARAGNGVILVTTKRGTVGKPSIKVNSTVTGQSVTNFPKPVSSGQYATLYREVQMNSGIPENQLKFTEEDVAKYYAGTDPDYPNTNWFDVLMRKWAPQQQHNISMSGGNNNVRYYTFIGYLDQEGMLKGGNVGYDRYNVRSNLDVSLSKTLTMSLDLSAIKEKTQEPPRSASDETFWLDFFDAKPYLPASLPDKSKVVNASNNAINPVIDSNEEIGGYDKNYKTSLKGALTLNYDVNAIKGLELKLKVDYYQHIEDRKKWRKAVDMWNYSYANDIYTKYGTSLSTQLWNWYNTNQEYSGQFSLNYDRVFNEKHTISALLLFEAIDYSEHNLRAGRRNFISTAIDQFFAGDSENQDISGTATESGRKSFVGRVNYNYQGKYLAEATVRYDGSPNFPKDKRWGTFPSISAGWRISEEPFIKDNISWISNLKLRGGVSQTGFDAVSAYQYLAGYSFSGVYVVNGSEVSALTTTGLPNTNITWETMTLSNIGLDLSFFDGKFYSEMDVFQRLREDMLGTRVASLPNTFGASLPDENINSQRTKGFELVLGYKGSKGNFKYNISGNISYSRSKWVHYDEVNYTDPDDIRLNQKTGKWTDVIYGYKSDGLFTSQSEIDNLTYDIDGQDNATLNPGDIKYMNLNDDDIIDWRDKTKIGNGGIPHVMYGINSGINYKNFDFSLFIQGAADYHVQLIAGNVMIDSERTPTKVVWEERWTPENNDINAIIPRQRFSQTTNKWDSDYWVKNASYLRLKNINLGYTFNQRVVHRIGIDQLRLFITGTNLFTINPVKKYGLDPESPASTRGWTYPIQKTISVGLNINL